MMNNENPISIGIETIYDEVPLSKNVSNQKMSNASNQAKTSNSMPKSKNYNQCVKILKEFDEAFKALPNYSGIEENLTMINGMVVERREWLTGSASKLKKGKAVINKNDIQNIREQVAKFFAQCDNAMDAYNSTNVFEEKNESIENMKRVFFSEKNRKIFESEGLGKEFAVAEAKVENYVNQKDKVLILLDDTRANVKGIKKDYKNFEDEVQNYFDRVNLK